MEPLLIFFLIFSALEIKLTIFKSEIGLRKVIPAKNRQFLCQESVPLCTGTKTDSWYGNRIWIRVGYLFPYTISHVQICNRKKDKTIDLLFSFSLLFKKIIFLYLINLLMNHRYKPSFADRLQVTVFISPSFIQIWSNHCSPVQFHLLNFFNFQFYDDHLFCRKKWN